MPTEISWVNLIAPIETHRFEDEYFGRRVLHQRRALVSPTGLEEITQWREALRGQSLTREGHRGRVVIDPSVRANTTLDGEIDREIDDLLSQGGPLIVDSINKISPPVESLAKAIAVGLQSFVGVNAYISPPRKDALDLHQDEHDVVVLQLSGEKLWTLGNRVTRGVANSRFFQIDKEALKADAIANDTFTTLRLGPGDLLYLPRGLFHRATASEGTSVHLSFGIRRPTGLDFIDLVMQRLIRETETREYAPRLGSENGDADVLAYLDRLRDRINRAAADPATAKEFLEQYRNMFSGVTDKD